MSFLFRDTFGYTEAVISESGGLKHFYHIADILGDDLKIVFSQKEDDFDNISWEFRFKRQYLKLQYSIYNGISIIPARTAGSSKKENKAVIELATMLEGRLFNDHHRNIA